MRSIILCPDRSMAARLTEGLGEFPQLQILRTETAYPDAEQLRSMLRTYGPNIVFVSFEDSRKALDLVRQLEKEAEGVVVVGIHSRLDSRLLREGMRVGVREFLVEPFDAVSLAETCANVFARLGERPVNYQLTEDVFAFLPAKAGVGASTIGLNVMSQMAHLLSGGASQRAVFVDLDMNSGMQRFLLGLDLRHTVAEAVANLHESDERNWSERVSQVGPLDVLHAGQVNPNVRIQPEQLLELSEFLERNYAAVGFDLSGNLERFSQAVMQRARKILLVSTPEIPSLYLAKSKLEFLKAVGLDRNVRLVLNRFPKNPLVSVSEVEQLVGLPVMHTIANSYYEVNQAAEAGSLLNPEGRVGGQCLELAHLLLETEPAPREKKSRFLEYFSVGSTPQKSEQWRD